jgi:hypothetical protein
LKRQKFDSRGQLSAVETILKNQGIPPHSHDS